MDDELELYEKALALVSAERPTSMTAFATALTALMRIPEGLRALHKRESLRIIARSELDDARKALLATVVERYLTLNEAE